MLNIADDYLRTGLKHARECADEKCASGCGIRSYEDQLEAPFTTTERRREERIKAALGRMT